jgi:hypothetical protein
MKPIPFAGYLCLCIALIASAVSVSNADPSNTEEIDCKLINQYDPNKNEWDPKIENVQDQLNNNGYVHIKNDGKFGVETISALKHYCLQRRFGELTIESKNEIDSYRLSIGDADSNSTCAYDYPTFDIFYNNYAKKEEIENPYKWNDIETKVNDLYSKVKVTHTIEESSDIVWDSGGCRCAPEFSKVIYGIYPYWTQADTTQDKDNSNNTVTLNYSMFSRIGFYAVFSDFSKKGADQRFRYPDLWKQKRAGFIRKAHKYRVKVDLVIHSSDWLTAVETKNDEVKTGLKNLVSRSKCDGVTLYFDSLPEPETPTDDNPDPMKEYQAKKESFRIFLKEFYSEAKEAKPPFAVNLMLPAGGFVDINKMDTKAKKFETTRTYNDGKKLTDFLSIVHQTQEEAKNQNEEEKGKVFVDLLLIFLHKPTSENKKEMRYRIESKFKGLLRRNVIRKVVPVITAPFDLEKTEQFEHDLIYFEDNFAGVALWPILTGKSKQDGDNQGGPTKNAEIQATDQQADKKPCFGDSIATINELIREHYKIEKYHTRIKRKADRICEWLRICPNRTSLLWIVGTGLLLCAGGGFGSLKVCELRPFFQRFFWFGLVIVALLVVLIFGLLACVPDWNEYTSLFALALAVILALVIVFRQIHRLKKEKYP